MPKWNKSPQKPKPTPFPYFSLRLYNIILKFFIIKILFFWSNHTPPSDRVAPHNASAPDWPTSDWSSLMRLKSLWSDHIWTVGLRNDLMALIQSQSFQSHAFPQQSHNSSPCSPSDLRLRSAGSYHRPFHPASFPSLLFIQKIGFPFTESINSFHFYFQNNFVKVSFLQRK